MVHLVALLQEIKPAVVAIAARLGQAETDYRVIGTGFNVDPEGLVITCRHVVEGFLVSHPAFPLPEPDQAPGELRKINVQLVKPLAIFTLEKNGDLCLAEIPFRYTGGMHRYDFAAIRLAKPPKPLPFLRLGRGSKVSEGTSVGICGYPLGLALHSQSKAISSTFQVGIISSLIPHPALPRDQLQWYRLDMNANPGNSGGPVFSLEDGEVVGILTARPQGVGRVIDNEGRVVTVRRDDGGVTELIYAMPSGLSDALPIDLVLEHIQKVSRLTEEDIDRIRDSGRLPDWWGPA